MAARSACSEKEADDGIIAERSDGFQPHVASELDSPFVVLFEQLGPNQTRHGVLVGEDTDDLAAALDLAIGAFERVGGVQLGAVLGREPHVGQYIGLGVIHQCRQLRHAWPCLVGDLSPLLACRCRVVLGKRGVDPCRDDTALGLAGISPSPISIAAGGRSN